MAVEAWLASDRNKYDFTHELDYTVGRVIPNGSSVAVPASKLAVFLKKDPSMPKGFRIITAYPE